MNNKKRKKVRALVLFSGGLDSILATLLLKEQGVEVELINFYTIFFDSKEARKSAKLLRFPLREVDISEDFLKILKNPKYGFGAGVNPCIDCHILMLKKAGQIRQQENFDLVATGEVLNERPMSQNKKALKIIEEEANLKGYLIRPLSAKFFEPTLAEKAGLIDKEKLLDIFGRQRQRQIELAKKFRIMNYPSPAGGCALTQSGFAKRLRTLIENRPNFNLEDAKLVNVGRHFFYRGKNENGENVDYWFILGRSQEENNFLKNQKKVGDILVLPVNFAGPEVLIRGEKISKKIIQEAQNLILKYTPSFKRPKTNPLFEAIS